MAALIRIAVQHCAPVPWQWAHTGQCKVSLGAARAGVSSSGRGRAVLLGTPPQPAGGASSACAGVHGVLSADPALAGRLLVPC